MENMVEEIWLYVHEIQSGSPQDLFYGILHYPQKISARDST
jgi:hypothetical protein